MADITYKCGDGADDGIVAHSDLCAARVEWDERECHLEPARYSLATVWPQTVIEVRQHIDD